MLHAHPRRRGRGADPQDDRGALRRAPPSTSASGRSRIAWRRSLASHAAGIGLRALSIVDLACWDLAARLARPVDRGPARVAATRPMPATAIIGYPPGTMGPEETGAQTAELYAAGLAPLQGAHRRLRGAIRGSSARRPGGRPGRVAGHGRGVGLRRRRHRRDVRRTPSRTSASAGSRTSSRPVTRASCARLRDRIDVPIAMGDEQGGIYFPEALIRGRGRRRGARRPDLHGRHHRAAAGSSTRRSRPASTSRRTCSRTSTARSWRRWGYADRPIEWGIPFTGVHPMDDPLPQPVIVEGGRMAPLPEEPGLRPPRRRRLGPQPAP